MTQSVVLQRIANLELPEPAERDQPVSKPEEFFAEYELDGVGIFKEADVAHLNRLFERHLMTSGICFHDLFGLENERILRLLQPFLSETDWKSLVAEWRALFVQGYVGILRTIETQVHPPLNPSSGKLLTLPRSYLLKMREFSKRLLQALEAKKGEQACALLIKDWEANRSVLEKFLIHPQFERLLSGKPVSHCPYSSRLNPQGEEHVREALTNLVRYLILFYRGQNAAVKAGGLNGKIPFLEQLTTQVLSLYKCSDSEALASECRRVLEFITVEAPKCLNEEMQSWANYVLMAKQGMLTFQEWRLINNIPQEQAPFKSQEEFIEWLLRQYTFYTLTLSLSHDVSSTLENQILKYIDPTFRTSAAYLNRFFVNLEMIYATLQSTIAQTPAKSRLDERLLRLESELFQFLHSNEVKGPIYSLMKMKSEHAGYHLPLMDESLRALYAALSHFTDRMMKKLERIKTECSEAVDSDSLLKKTLRFSRLLVLVNDLGVVLRDRPQSPNNTSTLPEAFFSFLESPSDRDSADELAPGESPARKSEEETPSPPHLPTFSDVPPPSVAPTDEQQREEAPPSIVSTSEQKREETPPFVETKTDLVQQLPPIADILPSPEPLRDSPPADARGVPPPRISSRSSSTRTSPLPRRSPSPNTLARGILTTKKRNKLEKILSQLGLTPIRTRGGHTTWADEDKKTQMTVPHHTEISIGVRQDLYRRVTNSSISNDSEES